MTSKRYEIRSLPEDIGLHGEVAYSTDSRKDAERMIAIWKFQGRYVENLFVCEIDVPQWKESNRDA